MLAYHDTDFEPEPPYQEQSILTPSNTLNGAALELHNIQAEQSNLRLDYCAYHHQVHALQRIMWKIQQQTVPWAPPQPPELTPVMIAIKGTPGARETYTYLITYQSELGQTKAEMGAEMQRVRDELARLEVKRKALVVIVEMQKRGHAAKDASM